MLFRSVIQTLPGLDGSDAEKILRFREKIPITNLEQLQMIVGKNVAHLDMEVMFMPSLTHRITERVTLASQLKASAIAVRPITSRGKDAKKIDKIAQLAVSFHVAKNITALTGEKTIYVRIMRPDDDILTKPKSGTLS